MAASYLTKKLKDNPDLAAQCEAIAESLRNADDSDIRAIENAECITPHDLGIIINTRAYDMHHYTTHSYES